MKILKNNYESCKQENIKKAQSYPRNYICESCNSELEYDREDLRIGELGLVILDCPCCGYSNAIENHEDTLILTRDNIVFPDHFYHTSIKNGAIDCCTNERIKKYITEAIDYFRRNKDEFAWIVSTGNLHVTVFRYEDNEVYEVVVTNDHYHTDINFEEKDYKVVI